MLVRTSLALMLVLGMAAVVAAEDPSTCEEPPLPDLPQGAERFCYSNATPIYNKLCVHGTAPTGTPDLEKTVTWQDGEG